MFGRAQKQASQSRAAGKAAKLHSIALMLRGRTFAGKVDVGDVSHIFTYSPASAAVAGGKLQLTGNLTVTDARSNAGVSPHDLSGVRATLVAAQSGIGIAPPRKKLPQEIYATRPDLPIVESTGSLSFCGVLYFKLAPLDGRNLGMPADLKQLQLNVRLAPVSDAERALQAAFSAAVDALYGQQVDTGAANTAVSELNTLLTGS